MINPQIKIVHVDQVKVEETQQARNGKEYNKIGIKTSEGWMNNIFFDGKQIDQIADSQGKDLEIVIYEEEYNGNMYKKFKLPSRTDKIDMRVITLEARFDKAAALIAKLQKALEDAGLVITEEKPAETAPPHTSEFGVPGELDPIGQEYEEDEPPF